MTRRYYEVKGAVGERGLTQGRAFHHQRHRLFQRLKSAFIPFGPAIERLVPTAALELVARGAGRHFLEIHRPALERFDSLQVLPLLSGVAKGLGLPPTVVYGANAGEVLGAKLPYIVGCSALAFSGDSTSDGRPRIAYNHDVPTAFAPFIAVRCDQPEDGYRSFSLGYPTSLGAYAGLNEAGLACCLNHAWTIDVQPHRPAVLVSLLLRACLDRCSSVGEALALIESTTVPNGSIVTLVDATGARAMIEVSPTRTRRRAAEATVLMAANMYDHSEMKSLEIPLEAYGRAIPRRIEGRQIHRSNLRRIKRFQHVIDSNHRYTDREIHILMSNHDRGAGDENSICRHRDHFAETVFSVILDPGAGRLGAIFGHPCRGQYRWFELGEAIL